MDSLGEGRSLCDFGFRETLNQTLAAFDYQFGALAQRDNELMKAYFGLM